MIIQITQNALYVFFSLGASQISLAQGIKIGSATTVDGFLSNLALWSVLNFAKRI
jgi:hypothetical protein